MEIRIIKEKYAPDLEAGDVIIWHHEKITVTNNFYAGFDRYSISAVNEDGTNRIFYADVLTIFEIEVKRRKVQNV